MCPSPVVTYGVCAPTMTVIRSIVPAVVRRSTAHRTHPRKHKRPYTVDSADFENDFDLRAHNLVQGGTIEIEKGKIYCFFNSVRFRVEMVDFH